MSNKFLLGIAACFFAIFAFGVGAIVSITHLTDKTTISVVPSTPEGRVPAKAFAAFQPDVKPLDSVIVPASHVGSAPPGLRTVTVTDINRLAAAVKLNSPNTGDVGRDVWERETPVAENLLKNMCDCDQRNWLNHFISTGKEAISGSQHYHESMQLLATLRRENADLSIYQPGR